MATLTPELQAHLEKEGYTFLCEKPNVGICGLLRFIYTTGLVIGLEKDFYHGRFCYTHPIHAYKDLVLWNGEGLPEGDWIKYKGVGGEFSKEDVEARDDQEVA